MSKNIDDITSKDLLEKLQELGLSDKEARVYMALLPRKDTGTSNLIRATGLHGQFVYAALARLETLGLAKHVIQNGRKKFSAGSPMRILSLVEEKRISAQAIVKQLETSFAGKHDQSFEVFQGEASFVAHEFALLEQMPDDGIIRVLGSGGDKYMAHMGERMDEFEARRIEKRVTVRYISTNGDYAYLKAISQARKYFEYRVLPGVAPDVNTDILSDKVVFQLYGNPVVSFTFANKQIAEGYQQFFEVLWNLSTIQSPQLEAFS